MLSPQCCARCRRRWIDVFYFLGGNEVDGAPDRRAMRFRACRRVTFCMCKPRDASPPTPRGDPANRCYAGFGGFQCDGPPGDIVFRQAGASVRRSAHGPSTLTKEQVDQNCASGGIEQSRGLNAGGTPILTIRPQVGADDCIGAKDTQFAEIMKMSRPECCARISRPSPGSWYWRSHLRFHRNAHGFVAGERSRVRR
jgi:hypothetical protein